MSHYVSVIVWNRGLRSCNQDSVLCQEMLIGNKRVWFGAVCDGVGGLSGGEEASGMVVEQLRLWFQNELIHYLRSHMAGRRIQKAGIRKLYGIHRRFRAISDLKQCHTGTTVTALLLYQNRYMVWHIGDSRLYKITVKSNGKRWKDLSIQKLTTDHARNKKELLKCLNDQFWQLPDILTGRIKKGNAMLLCSDGFCNTVTEEAMAGSLGEKGLSEIQLKKRLEEIARFSIKQGEQDNMSALYVRIEK